MIRTQISIFFLLVIILGLSVEKASAQIEVSASVDSSTYLIGDQIHLHIDARYPKMGKIGNIDFSAFDRVEALEIVNVNAAWDSIVSSGMVNLSKDIIVTIFDNGSYTIPSVSFTYTQNGQTSTVATNPVRVNVNAFTSTNNEEEANTIAPIKPIIEEPMNMGDWLRILLPILFIVLLLGIGYYLYYRFSKRGQEEKTIVVKKDPAHIIALGKLQSLKAANLWQNGAIKEYQTELTFIVREYLENRYDISALESTTNEILKDLKPISLSEDWKKKLREMLQLADLVKFAKADPPEEAHERLMQYAETFIETTKLLPQPESTETKEDV